MRSVLILLGACGAIACDSGTCDVDPDGNSLLQAKSLVRLRTKLTGAQELLQSVRNVADSLTEGSDVSMTPENVDAAMGTASSALQTMLPSFAQQHAIAQQEIADALTAVQACHDQHGGELMTRLAQAITNHRASKEQCDETLENAIEAEVPACEGQGAHPNCACNEARTAVEDQTALCASMTSMYEMAFCNHENTCGLLHRCHVQEMEVYNALRTDVESAMVSRQQQYRTVRQSECLMELITSAIQSGTPIPHASLTSCDDVSIADLIIHFPNVPADPAACPGPQNSDPQCDAGGHDEEALPPASPWQAAGSLAQLEATVREFPFTEWTYGVQYNHGWGDVHDVVINSWNRGIRVSVTPSYPQGDNAEALNFGTTVFTKDTDGQTPGEWIQRYWQDDDSVSSNGRSDHVSVFRRRLPTAWQAAGTLAQLESEVAQYPFTEWTYGVQYNHGWGDIHDVVINSWNRGIRVSATPFYPQGDNAEALNFGTTIFTRDTDGQTPGEWIQRYYQRDNAAYGHSNGNADRVQVFRQRL